MKLGEAARTTEDWAAAVGPVRARRPRSARADRDRLARPARPGRRPARPGRAGATPSATLQGLLGRRAAPAPGRRRRGRPPDDPGRPPDRRPARRDRPRARPGARTPSSTARPRRLLDAGQGGGDPRLLDEVGRSYPVAEVVPDALLALGRLHDGGGPARGGGPRLQAAARRRRRPTPTGPGPCSAWPGPTRRRGSGSPARDAYAQAAGPVRRRSRSRTTGTRRGSATVVAAPAGPAPVRPDDRRPAEPSLPVPLDPALGPAAGRRRSGRSPPRASRPRPRRAGSSSSRGRPSARSTRRRAARLVGRPGRRRRSGSATSPTGSSRRPRPGSSRSAWTRAAVDWQYDLGAPPARRRPGANPFARAEAAEPGGRGAPGQLHGFRVVGGRVFCLRGDRELLALDGDTGLVDWSFAPAGGHDQPAASASARSGSSSRSASRTRSSCSTRRPAAAAAEYPAGRGRGVGPRPPCRSTTTTSCSSPTAGRWPCSTSTAGVNSWVFRESREMPKNGPPRPARRRRAAAGRPRRQRADPARRRRRARSAGRARSAPKT